MEHSTLSPPLPTPPHPRPGAKLAIRDLGRQSHRSQRFPHSAHPRLPRSSRCGWMGNLIDPSFIKMRNIPIVRLGSLNHYWHQRRALQHPLCHPETAFRTMYRLMLSGKGTRKVNGRAIAKEGLVVSGRREKRANKLDPHSTLHVKINREIVGGLERVSSGHYVGK